MATHISVNCCWNILCNSWICSLRVLLSSRRRFSMSCWSLAMSTLCLMRDSLSLVKKPFSICASPLADLIFSFLFFSLSSITFSSSSRLFFFSSCLSFRISRWGTSFISFNIFLTFLSSFARPFPCDSIRSYPNYNLCLFSRPPLFSAFRRECVCIYIYIYK